jgi:hypothetical protein
LSSTGQDNCRRTLKSELGFRPVYHHKEDRVDGHLFITVLAYQFVQVIRRHLGDHQINASWSSIRQTLSGQCRVKASFRRADGDAYISVKPRVPNLSNLPSFKYKPCTRRY